MTIDRTIDTGETVNEAPRLAHTRQRSRRDLIARVARWRRKLAPRAAHYDRTALPHEDFEEFSRRSARTDVPSSMAGSDWARTAATSFTSG